MGLGLAAEAHDHVGRDCDAGHGLANACQTLEVVLDGVLPAHSPQDRIVTRLDRQVQVLAHRRARGHRGDQAVGQVPRVRGDEAEAGDRRQPVGGPEAVDRANELGEVGSPVEIEPSTRPSLGIDVPEAGVGRQIVAIAVDVLAEQRDLSIAGDGERACFVEDVVEGAAALGAAAEGDDAVGARLVAAVDDRQPGADRRAARDGTAGDGGRAGVGQTVGHADPVATYRCRRTHGTHAAEGAERIRGADRPDGSLRRCEPEAVHELRLLVRAEEHVDSGISARQSRSFLFAHGTAGEDDTQRRVGRLEAPQIALPANDLLLGRLADRAGIDDDKVRGFELRRLVAPGGEQSPGHLLRIAPVHLAAQRPQEEARQCLGLGQVLLESSIDERRSRCRRGGLADPWVRQIEDRQPPSAGSVDHWA